jgi:hypothetical protein
LQVDSAGRGILGRKATDAGSKRLFILPADRGRRQHRPGNRPGRAQALQGLLRHHDVSSLATATAALEDSDRTVRTLAAELLGKLRRPTSIEPLLAVLDRTRSSGSPGVSRHSRPHSTESSSSPEPRLRKAANRRM